MKKFIVCLVVIIVSLIGLLISISINLKYSLEIQKLKEQAERLSIDPTPTTRFFNRVIIAYKEADWDTVTINAKKYSDKITLIKEEMNYTICLYSSYAYYKLFLVQKQTDLLDAGLMDIRKYIEQNKKNSMAYFIRGLILITYPELSKEKIKEAKEAFALARKHAQNQNEIANIERHISILKEKEKLLK
jgi:hypothetical protein